MVSVIKKRLKLAVTRPFPYMLFGPFGLIVGLVLSLEGSNDFRYLIWGSLGGLAYAFVLIVMVGEG